MIISNEIKCGVYISIYENFPTCLNYILFLILLLIPIEINKIIKNNLTNVKMNNIYHTPKLIYSNLSKKF